MFFGGLILGLIGGLGLLYLSVSFGDRVHPQLRAKLSRMLAGPQSSADSVIEAVMQDLRKEDPALANVVESKPKVSIDSVPEALTPSQQREIEAAPTPDAAAHVAARFIPNPELSAAVVTLLGWKARRNYSESQYQNSFRRYANKHGYADRLLEKKRISWGGGGGTRIAVPDFILGEVLVELKAGLTASGETDRAMGQMLRYLLAWKQSGPAVLAICGDVSPEIRWLVFTYVRTWRMQLNLPVMVIFKQGAGESDDADTEMPVEPRRIEFGDA